MSNVKTLNTYNFEKNITGLEVNPSFILGLEQVIGYLILTLEDASTLPKMFKKFDRIVAGSDEQLEEKEAYMYTLFSLQQYFKYEAIKQGLAIETKSEIKEEHLKEYITQIYKGDFQKAEAKLKEIQELIKIDSDQDNHTDHKQPE